MNAWPTLKEWWQFGGTLALELAVVFAMTWLIVLRIRPAQWRRAAWQTCLVAMLLVGIGELNGVRGLLRPSAKPPATPPQHAVVVTLKDPDFTRTIPPAMAQPIPNQAAAKSIVPSPQRQAWPFLIWAAGLGLLLGRAAFAQAVAFVFRMTCRRVNSTELTARTERMARALGIRRRVLLIESRRTAAPFTFGVWKPVIVLPHHFINSLAPEQQDAVLAHELAHVAGFDSAWRGLSSLVCALLWWHPGAWLAKRELDHVSELVADEASLLTSDGPNQLAECLVACAKQLRRPAFIAWLGMDGGGFRSALGQRVARLLQLKAPATPGRRIPWYLRVLAPLLCVFILWLAMAALVSPPEPRAAWPSSIIGSAFAAAAETKASRTPETIRARVERLVQEGKVHYETGRLQEAEAALREAEQLDPNNNAATYYLWLLRMRKEAAEIGTLQAATTQPAVEGESKRAAPVRTNDLQTSQERQQLSGKLRSIRLSEFGPIDNLPLSEVIRSLSDQARRLDPEKKGINFFLTPLAGRQPEAETPDLHGVAIRVSMTLRDITLEQALRILVDAAGRPIQFTVEDYGVLITPVIPDRAALQTRFFRVDPATLSENLKMLQPPGTNRRPARNAPPGHVMEALTTFLKSSGINLTAAPKSIFFNDRLGTLVVRATAEDLDLIEKTLQMLNMAPQQVTLRVKVLEVPMTSSNAAWDWFMGGQLSTNAPATKGAPPTITGILTGEQFRSTVRDLEKRGGTDLLSAPEVTTMSGREAQIKVVDIRYIVTALDRGTTNAAAKTSETANPAAADRAAKKRFYEEQRARVEAGTASPLDLKLAEAELARAASESEKSDPLIMPVAEPFELGPIINITPYVSADGYTIQMTVLPTMREFLGYDDPGAFVATDHKELQQPTPLPKFRLRQATATATVWDGQTLVIAVGTARDQNRERHRDRTITTNYTEKALFFFVTPRLIDPAGNALHSDEELKAAHQKTPRQEEERSSIHTGVRVRAN